MSAQQRELERRQLEMHLNRSGLSYRDLWLRQIAVGGDADAFELEAYVLGLLTLDPHQHNIIAQALNEYFLDRDKDHPVPYSEASDDGTTWGD